MAFWEHFLSAGAPSISLASRIVRLLAVWQYKKVAVACGNLEQFGQGVAITVAGDKLTPCLRWVLAEPSGLSRYHFYAYILPPGEFCEPKLGAPPVSRPFCEFCEHCEPLLGVFRVEDRGVDLVHFAWSATS
jgi:hypothetical protein